MVAIPALITECIYHISYKILNQSINKNIKNRLKTVSEIWGAIKYTRKKQSQGKDIYRVGPLPTNFVKPVVE